MKTLAKRSALLRTGTNTGLNSERAAGRKQNLLGKFVPRLDGCKKVKNNSRGKQKDESGYANNTIQGMEMRSSLVTSLPVSIKNFKKGKALELDGSQNLRGGGISSFQKDGDFSWGKAVQPRK